MSHCVSLTKEMLRSPIRLMVDDAPLTFMRAKQIADNKARESRPDAMLLAWYDGNTGCFSPRVECCSEKKPGWLVYAETRGGDIVIDINDEEYVFVYC